MFYRPGIQKSTIGQWRSKELKKKKVVPLVLFVDPDLITPAIRCMLQSTQSPSHALLISNVIQLVTVYFGRNEARAPSLVCRVWNEAFSSVVCNFVSVNHDPDIIFSSLHFMIRATPPRLCFGALSRCQKLREVTIKRAMITDRTDPPSLGAI